MRTREMTLADYGVPPEDQGRLYEHCRQADVSDRLLLIQCAISAAPGLEVAVYDSLVNDVGYDTINRFRTIPAKRDDFYAYRRKTLAVFYDKLRLFGRWKD